MMPRKTRLRSERRASRADAEPPAQPLPEAPASPGAAAAPRAEGGGRPVLEIEGLRKSYRDPKHPAVAGLDLTVYEGEILCLLGPSGCGKTTLLRLIAGFEEPDRGRVRVGGREVVGPGVWLPPERRPIGFVFQDYALFPHLNVLRNVAFGLREGSRRERLRRAEEVLDLVGLTIFRDRYPHQLSGGQQQRVALARALAPRPEVILLDEPFSSLDAALRGSTREEVRRILEAANTTTILVTHDQDEALAFSDRLAAMRAGRIEQLGAPEAVYTRPRTAFVAGFLGRTNLLRGAGRGEVADTPLGPLALTRPITGPLLLSLRPQDLAFTDGPGVAVAVLGREFRGHDLIYTCRTIADPDETPQRLLVQALPDCPLRVGEVARLASRGPAVPLEGSGPAG